MPLPRSDFTFMHTLRVRWAEVDAQGIVFNGHYLTYFDVGITEYWRAAGLRYPDAFATADTDLFLVKATLEYRAPARFDDLLDIAVRVDTPRPLQYDLRPRRVPSGHLPDQR